MSFGREGFLGGVKFHPNIGAGETTTSFINRRVEEKRKVLHEKIDHYGKDYREVIHGIQRNRKKLKSTSMLEYSEQMTALQQNRWFVPAQSVVHTYDGRPKVETRQLPRNRQLPRLSRSVDGIGFQVPDRTSICSPKSILSKSCSVPTVTSIKRRGPKTDAFRLKFDKTEIDSKDTSGRITPSQVKLIPKSCASPEPPSTKTKVNTFTGIVKGETCSSKGKTVTIKLPVSNKDTNEEGMTLTLEPELVVDKDCESNVSTLDESSEYDLDIPSTSALEEENMKARRRVEHTRTLLRDAVDKLKEIEEKYKNPTPIVIPKFKKKKRLKLSNSLDSIPESISETDKQETVTGHRRRYFPSPHMVRTPRTPVVIKPSLDVIPEINTKHSATEEETQNIYANRPNAFKGSKLNTRYVSSPDRNSRHFVELDSSSELTLRSQHHKHIVTAKIEDDFKSKRLNIGSKFGIKHKKLKFLKSY